MPINELIELLSGLGNGDDTITASQFRALFDAYDAGFDAGKKSKPAPNKLTDK